MKKILRKIKLFFSPEYKIVMVEAEKRADYNCKIVKGYKIHHMAETGTILADAKTRVDTYSNKVGYVEVLNEAISKGHITPLVGDYYMNDSFADALKTMQIVEVKD